MSRKISHLAYVDPRAELADDIEIGPFCYVGPSVSLGRGCRLDSHVTIVGNTTVGERNRFYPNAVIGAEPQDISYQESETAVIIGDDNVFREGVTVNRGAEKEDHVTRIGNRNMLMANSHVAHNCHIYNGVILVNGVLLGGHVHVHDGAIISGNCVVHHFSTLGKLSFVSGGCRVPHDIPPFMLAAGSDNPTIKTINLVGMQRAGISRDTISLIKRAYKMLYREFKTLDNIHQIFSSELDNVLPIELASLLTFIDQQRKGRMGRAREAFRNAPAPAEGAKGRKAA
ncbi:MAG: acyl-ACP--UDP-N-acetylglucosamine O-acyltransferase [Planctomycetaceae bacterium]|nr:acyl-ACP--UDP-N-acetylglucosamine O-acyltransferase [Planctomycetaceae bacterium]